MSNAKQFIRFGIVGIANTGFSYSIYVGFLMIGLPYPVANFFALVLGILFSFCTQSTLVFRKRDKRLFLRFLLSWVIIYICNILFIKVMLRSGFDVYYSGAIAILPIAVFSYILQRFFVFRTRATPASATAE
ncbi:MAG: GtrA family protein [Candidatus Methylumidiphilus sp.]